MLRNPGVMEIALERFAKAVVKKARFNLTRGGHKFNDRLYKSLDDWEVKVTKNSIFINFSMEEYGEYQDRGVKGAANFKSHKMKVYTPFKFKDKAPPPKALKEWSRSKGLNEFAVSRSIYLKGIPQTLFFTKAFKSTFNDLPETILEVFRNDVDDILKYSTQRKR